MNEVIKFDQEQKLVFGWANIIKDEDGEVYIDSQGDFIDDIGQLEKAAYDYVLHSRNGAEMHINQNVARVVESFVVTPDKLEALGLVSKSDSVPAGWWIGFKVDDDSVWEKVKDGSYSGFSVHGKGQRELVDMEMLEVGKAISEKDEKKLKRHSKHHTPKHIKDMRKRILSGKTFNQAHMESQKAVGKGAGKDKIGMVMREFYAKKLKNAQGKIVTDRGQAMAIAIAQSKKKVSKRLKNPKGGLTAAGRAHFKRTEGANLKPGVKGAANTPEKMRRKGSFLTRFYTNPSGPMKKPNGKPTRLALAANAWGEPVPQNRSDAAKLAAKGRRLLDRYQNVKKDLTPGDVHVETIMGNSNKKKKKKKKVVAGVYKAKPVPTKPKLWASALAEARAKFDVYPSAYANAWAAKRYKSKGGTWKMGKK